MIITDVTNLCCAKVEWTNKISILQSRYTAHLCGDKALFQSLCDSSKAKLILASKASAEVKGTLSSTDRVQGQVVYLI